MKKILFFLITILITLNIQVHAEEQQFYEAEYIDNIYMNKVMNNTIYYQKARFFRNKNNNEAVYCIEPEVFFHEQSKYEETTTPYNLSEEQINRISLLAHYGYNYKNHTENKWYAITQLLIWQTAYPQGKYYFTDTLNGNKITIYEEEINELENLLISHNTKPSFDSKTIYIAYGKSVAIKDQNNIINNYLTQTPNTKIYNNMLTISNFNPGNYTIKLKKKDEHNKSQKIYVSNDSQNIITIGNTTEVTSTLNIIIQNTSITVNKIDKDTKNNIPQGNASLLNSKFIIYTQTGAKILEFTLSTNPITIDKLDYGIYYIKEKEPGIGYKLNEEKQYFEITKNNPQPTITIENKVIAKEIIINKLYGSNENFKPEQNISFNIYDSSNQFITTIKTNEQGIATITLPYGKYTIKQLTTTEGYEKVNPIQINVEDEEQQIITLKNYKINVPNTSSNIIEYILGKLKRLCRKLNILLQSYSI